MLQEKIIDEIKQISDKKLVEICDCGTLLSDKSVAGIPSNANQLAVKALLLKA
ncbi:MAG: hypothetical protein HOP36_09530 [Methyloglobulus sp.]|nr:hypothetical protein [Methyloglobulus sp.]